MVSKATKDVSTPLFIIGIGASAGGLAAFEAFFSQMLPKKRHSLACVIVQHLSPDYKSMLPELLRKYTKMKVHEAKDGMRVETNSLYIIPPDHYMEIQNAKIKITTPDIARGHRLAIDYFFDSLAKEKGANAIAVVLSGLGSDGAEGIKEIKKSGGLVLAQSADCAEFPSMPLSAIDTGVVDFILAPQEMPAKILAYIERSAPNATPLKSQDEATILQKIFLLLEKRTSHDFSLYKPSTIGRRIDKRMRLKQLAKLKEYLALLEKSPQELEALFDDLLIGVTSFFRDIEAYGALQKSVERLLKEKKDDLPIRVWSAGCSSGEEAYSLAILFVETMEKLDKKFRLQIFATDIDANAIASARAGVYSFEIERALSSSRLKKYFVKNAKEKNYKICQSVRELVVFSTHDLIKDPPFSKLDLISCRNLLIYLTLELQEQVLGSFFYALKENALLFLGSSESLGKHARLFDLVDLKSKLFRSKKHLFETKTSHFLPLSYKKNHLQEKNDMKQTKRAQTPLPFKEIMEKALLSQIAPTSMLVNEEGDILYLHGKSELYLELPSGEIETNNILKMAKEGLKQALFMAFSKAKLTRKLVKVEDISVENALGAINIDLTISAVVQKQAMPKEASLYLVIFQKIFTSSQEAPLQTQGSDETRSVQKLRRSLQIQEEYLRDLNEKLECSNDELKSYNEEIQSVNEELQSTNEELETSKEELQSLNEELSTLNAELNSKIIDLSRANNDMNNLLAGTGIGTIFVDKKLCVLRFTPAVAKIVNLIKSDIGRPITHITSNLLQYENLAQDIKNVLNTLTPKEIQLQTKSGKWYLMNIQAYRTLENVVEGAVLSFVDITEMVHIKEELARLAKK